MRVESESLFEDEVRASVLKSVTFGRKEKREWEWECGLVMVRVFEQPCHLNISHLSSNFGSSTCLGNVSVLCGWTELWLLFLWLQSYHFIYQGFGTFLYLLVFPLPYLSRTSLIYLFTLSFILSAAYHHERLSVDVSVMVNIICCRNPDVSS